MRSAAEVAAELELETREGGVGPRLHSPRPCLRLASELEAGGGRGGERRGMADGGRGGERREEEDGRCAGEGVGGGGEAAAAAPPLARATCRAASLRICVGGERESIFGSPLSSRCKVPAVLPHLLEMDFVRHSDARGAKMALHFFVGVSLICLMRHWCCSSTIICRLLSCDRSSVFR